MRKILIKLACIAFAIVMALSFAACQTDSTNGSGNNSTDSGNTDSGNTDSGNTDGGNTDGDNTDGDNTDSGNTDSGNTDGGNSDGGDTEVDDGNSSEVITEKGLKAYTSTESLYLTWDYDSAQSATVKYRAAGETAWTTIDSELITYNSDTRTARADVLGLSADTSYDVKISFSDGKSEIYDDLTVSAYDRSGYAHFNYTDGVGAYNDDGTLKDGALVIYVSEENKNTVTATLGGTVYTGIVSILGNLSKSDSPVAIRVIGQISAATWNSLTGDGNDNVIAEIKSYMSENDLSELSQDKLIELGYNTLNTDEYSVLNGLSSKITYDGTDLDSAFNNCNISYANNVTLEGVGEGAELFQWGLTWKCCNSIEVRNLTFDDYTEDACSFEGTVNATTIDGFGYGNYWIHNNQFNEGKNYWDVTSEQDKAEGDGATDFKKVAYVTISYNHYYQNHKTGLVGGSDSHTTASLTFHHNYYEECNSRLPLGRQANMHMYNNYYSGTTGTNMSLRASAYAFIENCYFDNAKNPVTTENSETYGSGVAKIYGCIFSGIELDTTNNNVTVVESRTQAVTNTNQFGQTFDTDSSIFYYKDGASDVENMLTAEQVKELVPLLAGTLKGTAVSGGYDDDSQEGEETDPGDNESTVPENAVTNVVIDNYVSVLSSELLQGSAPVYFNSDYTVTTTSDSSNKAISWYGNNTSVVIKQGGGTIDSLTVTNGIQTGGSSNSERRYFIIDLSDYVGKTVTITAYASHTSGTANTDDYRGIYVYDSVSNIGTSDYVAASELSTGNKDLVCVTYTVAVTAENCMFYIAGQSSIIIYSVGFTVA